MSPIKSSAGLTRCVAIADNRRARRAAIFRVSPLLTPRVQQCLYNKPPIDADGRRSRLDQITEKIIGCVHRVSNVLGPGFLEKVYENGLAVELRQIGLQVAQQHRIEIRYKDVLVGDFVADLLIEGCVIVEVKAVKALDDVHTAQCLNYLKATGLQVCLLVNFGAPRATVRRVARDF